MPRGIRNNNPGNIRKTSTHWKGEIQDDHEKSFESFDKPEDGLRALMKVLVNYKNQHDLSHVQGLISRWAPPLGDDGHPENDTEAYVAAVAQHVGFSPLAYFDIEVPDNLIRMSQAIVRHENGKCPDPTLPWWYPEETYEAAAGMALGYPSAVIT